MVPSPMKPLLQSKHVVSCLVKMCLPQHLAIGGLRKLVEVGEASAELAVLLTLPFGVMLKRNCLWTGPEPVSCRWVSSFNMLETTLG